MRSKISILFILICSFNSSSQSFMMQGWYWDYPKGNWANTLQAKASELGNAGFTDVWVPPLARASFGNNSNGYDPKDLYDYGEFGGGATGVGTRAQVDAMVSAFSAAGINTVADMVYNHRDGGKAEKNDPVKSYITNYYSAVKEPFPSDRVRMVIPLGGSSGNGAGNYYIKVSSKTNNSRFSGKNYKFYCWTNKTGWQGLPDENENEPNGGGDCGQSSRDVSLGINYLCALEIGTSCNTDEFHLNLAASDFNSTDTLFIDLNNTNGYADQRIYGVWSSSLGQDIVSQVEYQTYTDFSGLPSGQGAMNYDNFKPNSANASSTYLNGDWDSMLFFYDYDQNQQNTQDVLNAWTKWNWENVGIRGFRMDAVKHFPPSFVTQLNTYLSSNGISPSIFVGEYFDLGASNLRNWVNSVPTNVRTFDFSLRDALKKASDCYGYDVRNVFNAGMVGYPINDYKYRAITFVNNHDLRESLSGNGGCSGDDYDTPIQNNTMLGYAYLLTNNQIGIPCVFYPDYYGVTIPNAPTINLKTKIDSLINIHQNYIFGAPDMEYLSRFSSPYPAYYVPGTNGSPSTSLIYQIHGGAGGVDVIVAINYAGVPLDVYQAINTTWGGGPGTGYQNLIGNAGGNTTITNNNEIHITIPAFSYSVWIRNDALPVQLLSFQVKNVKNEAVELNWEVADEKGVHSYIVERMDETERFTTIGEVKSTGNSQYHFLDKNPIFGKNQYYRIRILDEDGSDRYSPIRPILLEKIEQKLLLFPNPTSDKIYLLNRVDNENDTWQLHDNFGRIIREWQGLFPTEGLDLSQYPIGVYSILQMKNNASTNCFKFIKI